MKTKFWTTVSKSYANTLAGQAVTATFIALKMSTMVMTVHFGMVIWSILTQDGNLEDIDPGW